MKVNSTEFSCASPPLLPWSLVAIECDRISFVLSWERGRGQKYTNVDKCGNSTSNSAKTIMSWDGEMDRPKIIVTYPLLYIALI